MGEFRVLESPSNEELAILAQEGCRASFAELVQRFQVPLLHFLLQRTGGLHDAEDLTQDVFVRAFRSLRRYQPQWRFSTWLYTIAHRLSLNARRRWRPTIDGRGLEAISSATPSAEDVLVAAEQSSRLWRFAAGVLTTEQLTTLWLFYVEEMPLEEIARVLGRSAGAAKGLLFRGRRKLAESLEEQVAPKDIAAGDEDNAPAGVPLTRVPATCATATQQVDGGAVPTSASGNPPWANQGWKANTKNRPAAAKPGAEGRTIDTNLFQILPPRLAAELYDA